MSILRIYIKFRIVNIKFTVNCESHTYEKKSCEVAKSFEEKVIYMIFIAIFDT